MVAPIVNVTPVEAEPQNDGLAEMGPLPHEHSVQVYEPFEFGNGVQGGNGDSPMIAMPEAEVDGPVDLLADGQETHGSRSSWPMNDEARQDDLPVYQYEPFGDDSGTPPSWEHPAVEEPRTSITERIFGKAVADSNTCKNEEGAAEPLLPSAAGASQDDANGDAAVSNPSNWVILLPPPQPQAQPVLYGPAPPPPRNSAGGGWNTVPARSYMTEDFVTHRAGSPRGLAGLSNLGNTCFMNSSLQCLMHSVPLMKAFLSQQYKIDINRSNPLGMKGELAEAFGSLIGDMWQLGVSTISPRGFKSRLALFAPQFGGYQQHDSQEFLAFLLDGLHEDLNRVINKPYIEEKDAGGRPDEVVADEAWSTYRARNDSIIVDHFQGLYKSQLDCPTCCNSSIKFDPFMYLSLPLPESRTKNIEVTLVHMDGSVAPYIYGLTVSFAATLLDALRSLAELAGVLLGPQLEANFCCTSYTMPSMPSSQVKYATILSDLSARVVDSLEMSATLLVYYFSDPQIGPTSGHPPTFVHHRKQRRASIAKGYSINFSVPLLFFMPPEKIYGEPEADGITGGNLGLPAVINADAPIWSYVMAALQPFKIAAMISESMADDQVLDGGTPPASDLRPDLDNGSGNRSSWPADDKAQDDDLYQSVNEPYADNSGTQSAWEQVLSDPPTSSSKRPLGEAVEDSYTYRGGHNNSSVDVWASRSNTDLDQTASPEVLSLTKYQPGYSYSSDAAAGALQLVLDWPQSSTRYDLSVMDRLSRHHTAEQPLRRTSAPPAPVSLSACIEAFLRPERLTSNDTWYCSKCRTHVAAVKKLDLWALPEVLVVHLKRFSYTRHARDKLETLVEFPVEGLDLSSYVLTSQAQAPIYDLYAVSNHYGSLGGGHYTAYARMPGDGPWYSFDDSFVQTIKPTEIVNPAAYVLFYRRRAEADADPRPWTPDSSVKDYWYDSSMRLGGDQDGVGPVGGPRPAGGSDAGDAPEVDLVGDGRPPSPETGAGSMACQSGIMEGRDVNNYPADDTRTGYLNIFGEPEDTPWVHSFSDMIVPDDYPQPATVDPRGMDSVEFDGTYSPFQAQEDQGFEDGLELMSTTP